MIIRFLALSAVVAIAAWGALVWGHAALWPQASRAGVHAGVSAAYVVSTGGWLVVLRGLRASPHWGPHFVMAGMVVKLVLFGVAAGFLALAVPDLGTAWLIPFAAAFILIGFCQLAVVVRRAVNRLEKVDAARESRAVEFEGHDAPGAHPDGCAWRG